MSEETNTVQVQGWDEDSSEVFVDQADIFVPSRPELIDTITGLIPARHDEPFTVVELGSGDGTLARSVLQAYPNCRYLAKDGSPTMRQRLSETLAPFGERFEIDHFELVDEDWREGLPGTLRCVLASLIVHHLDTEGKRKLFRDVASRLEPGGAFIVMDLAEPMSDRVKSIFAAQWYQAVRAQSLEKTGELKAFDFFRDDGWNFYDVEVPDEFDQPSRLVDQLVWLKEAGFKEADCFWMRAGHAVFGGRV